ncbi:MULTISPECIES: hypothetical protein [Actinoalloteichus]|uniref:Glycosyltransferase n=1 Tax=Actinoalloteichus fjordicus TaxID=1612552 RepID=A0AAC9LHU2_9PSEU|nr:MULTISPECIES: hypothetical protein [Actinoalloteichus]APU16630.1 hypothetical protein UA74_23060 [Actinoalloteichus fjordicus]APU22696.1 hypothetical protein UA75_23570 [Actinoalloteichus sp. GBA129-24]
MFGEAWIRGPVSLGGERWLTRSGCKQVLVLVPTLVAGVRLLDVLPLLETDHRIQLFMTASGDSQVWPGARDFADAQGFVRLPWQQATQTRFDLVLAATREDLEHVKGPVLALPHGASLLKSRLRPADPGRGYHPEHGLSRQYLTYNGRLLQAGLALTHDDELDALAEACPEALPTAVVAGDLCFDRLRASLPFREEYRRAFGAQDGRTLVVVSSTWTEQSGFGEHAELFHRVAAGLPRDEFLVVGVLHPNTWTQHGRSQVRAWLGDALDAGLVLLPPERGWHAALIAADCVIGDHGSVTVYGAALDRPVLLAACPEFQLRPDGLAASVARRAGRLRLDGPIRDQVEQAIRTHPAGQAGSLAAQVTSRPDQAGGILRQMMYRLLGLDEPVRGVPVSPVPLPDPLPQDGSIPR